MEDFNTSLVREKITFVDPTDTAKEPVVIRSNRIFFTVRAAAGEEKVVIRAQNMHTTLRLCAKMVNGFLKSGSFTVRSKPIDWEGLWKVSVSSYERQYNPNIWGAIYINGKPVFKTITSPFVDVIEKCALATLDNYGATMEVTEHALKHIGYQMNISHSSNVASVISDVAENTKCGIIHRTDGKDLTFNFTVTGRGKRQDRVVQTLGITAAYLEAFSLRNTIRPLNEKLRQGLLEKRSPEGLQMRSASSRHSAISKAISSFEEIYSVVYTPAKPDLSFTKDPT
jgi:hypothetical protein